MKCPHCEELLLITERQGIEMDYCPKCRGVWLDKGELDKIIERIAGSPPKSSKEVYEEDEFKDRGFKDGSHQNRRKRGGFLNNLFDFD